MTPGITISKFLKAKEITTQELKDNFTLVRRIRVNMTSNKSCPNCGDTVNYFNHSGEDWTYVNSCVKCRTIMVTYVTDRMGGGNIDTVDVYEQMDKPMYRLYFKCDIQKDCIECLYCGTVSNDKNDIDNLFCKTCNKTLK